MIELRPPSRSSYPSAMPTDQAIPALPELGHSENYYVRGAHRAETNGNELKVHSYKVGQYITLAMDYKLTWEEKLRYLKHTLNKHCVPPKILEDNVWGFYKELQRLVKDAAGQEALRIASAEDDMYAALLQMGRDRAEIENRAEVFFKRLIPCEECPEFFHDTDYAQLKLIRDQWI